MSWMAEALLAALFGGLVAIFGKIGIQGVDSLTATTLRSLIMAGMLSTVALMMKRLNWSSLSSIGTRPLIFIILAGAAGAASWFFYFRALQHGPVSKIAPIDRFSVVIAIVGSVAILGDRPSPAGWLGAGLVTLGVLVLAFA